MPCDNFGNCDRYAQGCLLERTESASKAHYSPRERLAANIFGEMAVENGAEMVRGRRLTRVSYSISNRPPNNPHTERIQDTHVMTYAPQDDHITAEQQFAIYRRETFSSNMGYYDRDDSEPLTETSEEGASGSFSSDTEQV